MAELRMQVSLPAETPDQDAVDRVTREIKAEMTELAPGQVTFAASERPQGVKGTDAVSLGELVVTIAGSSSLTAIVQALLARLRRGRPLGVQLTIGGDSIELTDASSAEQAALVKAWLARHSDT